MLRICINRCVSIGLIVSILSGCTSLPIDSNTQVTSDNTINENDKNELKNISQSLLDLTASADDKPANNNEIVQASDISSPVDSSVIGNAFLAQQAEKMKNVSEQTQATYQKAVSLSAEQKWDEANAAFDRVIEVHPDLSGAYVNKAIIALKQEQIELALDWATKAITVNSKNPYAHNALGQIYRLQGDFSLAETHYLTAIDIWPDYADAYLNLAVLLDLYRGRLVDAQSFYQAYLDFNPEDKMVNKWLAALNIKIQRAQ